MTRREPPRRRSEGEERERAYRPQRPRPSGRRPSDRPYPPEYRQRYYEEDEWWDEDGYYPPRKPAYRERRPARNYEDEYEREEYRRPRPRRPQYEDEYWEDEYPPQRPRAARPVHSSRVQQNTEPESKKKNGSKVVFSLVYNLLFYVLTIGILLSAVLFAFSSKSNASIFGYRFYTVLTDSMVPQEDSPPGGFYSGDMVLVHMVDSDQIEEGDIVTFAVGDGSRYLTHRLVDRLDELAGEPGDYIVTKGDANETNDPPVEASRVLGKVVFTIPKVGSMLEFVRENLVLCVLFILSTFGFILVLKAYLFGDDTAKDKGNTKRRPQAV